MQALYYIYERRMLMRAAKVSSQRQYELIMECRSSGMTDSQWCMQHGIKPGTFYNWVSRLRKNSCLDIPKPACGMEVIPSPKQEVVKLEVMQETDPAIIDSPSKEFIFVYRSYAWKSNNTPFQ
jgi:transposase-like protein